MIMPKFTWGQVLCVVLQLSSLIGCMGDHDRIDIDLFLIDNTKPRTDTNGDIVNAHQGKIARFQGVDGTWRYYWVGSSWDSNFFFYQLSG
eukprot:m.224163 g.224163  ORF g.224163 m.224163 type:complete len:90 (-) comp33422_c0_seq1:26-295(-)